MKKEVFCEELTRIASEMANDREVMAELERTGEYIGYFEGGSVSLWYIIDTEERFKDRYGEIAIYDLSVNGLCLKLIDSKGYVMPQMGRTQAAFLEANQEKILEKLKRVGDRARSSVALKEVAV